MPPAPLPVGLNGRPTTRRVHLRALTGLRIVAALWVVLFHWTSIPSAENATVRRVLHPLVYAGYIGVDLFFVISGFVLTLTYLEALGPRLRLRPALRFYWARVCRVWPAYAVVTVLFGLWLVSERLRVGPGRDITFQNVQPSLGWRSWVEQLLLVQQWRAPFSDGVSFVGATWTVSAEMAAYVLFPLLALALHRLRRVPVAVLAVVAVACTVPVAVSAVHLGTPYYRWSWAVRLGAAFVAGSLVCLAVTRVQRTARVERLAGAVAVLTVVELAIVLVWADGRPGDVRSAAVVLFPVLVGALALSERGLAGLLARPTAVLGGRMSYSLYLVHVPIFEIFWVQQIRRPALQSGGAWAPLLLPNLIVVALVAGLLLWRLVEEPARVWLRALVEGSGRTIADLPARHATPRADPPPGAEPVPLLLEPLEPDLPAAAGRMERRPVRP